MINEGLIDGLELSVTSENGGEEKVDYHLLLAKFKSVSKETIGDTTFYSARL